MSEWSRLVFGMIVDLFRSRAALEAEIVVLRQQLNVLRRACPKKRQYVSSQEPLASTCIRLNALSAITYLRALPRLKIL